jgi:hypothetical protein
MTFMSFDWPTWLKVAVDCIIIIIAALSGHAAGFRKASRR